MEGEELVCLAEIRVWDLMRALSELSMKQVRLWTRRGLKLIGVRA